jgi:hypothetical protein
MRLDIGSLFRRAKEEAVRREGPSPGMILTQPELEKFAELVALECAKTVADPAIYMSAHHSMAYLMAEQAIKNRLK